MFFIHVIGWKIPLFPRKFRQVQDRPSNQEYWWSYGHLHHHRFSSGTDIRTPNHFAFDVWIRNNQEILKYILETNCMFHWCDRLVLFVSICFHLFLIDSLYSKIPRKNRKWIQVVANQILRYFLLSTLKCSIRLCWSCYHLLLKCLLLFAHLFWF